MTDEPVEPRPESGEATDRDPVAAIESLALEDRAARYSAIADELREVLEGADGAGA